MCTKLGDGLLSQEESELGSMPFPQRIKAGIVVACACLQMSVSGLVWILSLSYTNISGHPRGHPSCVQEFAYFLEPRVVSTSSSCRTRPM